MSPFNSIKPESNHYRAITLRDIRLASKQERLNFVSSWLVLNILSVALGLASVKMGWSGIPVEFGGADFSLTLYPPLTICSLLTLWFGFWWGAVPAYISTFCLSIYFQMSPSWAALFALSDPIAFAVFIAGYRAISLPLTLRSAHSLLSFVLLVFLGGILSSVGTFIWSYTGHYTPQQTLNIWQGWWVGYVAQSVVIGVPILLLFSEKVTNWRDKTFPFPEKLKPLNQRGLLFSIIILLSSIYLFILLSVLLSNNIIRNPDKIDSNTLSQQIELLKATSHATYLVIGFLFFALAYLGYHLIVNWNKRLLEAIDTAQQAAKAKSAFLARMSHEIRTPMNAIIGLSEIALHKSKDPRQKDYLSKIRLSADSLLILINDILDFSKSEAGKLQLENKPFFLEEVVSRVVNQIAMKIFEKDIEFVIDIEKNSPSRLVGDRVKLEQVLLNLLSNAAKFTNKGEIRLSIHPGKSTADKIELNFTVQDTGVGIPASRINNLFQPFTQADESITRKYGGTGLGLAICKQIVDAMNGNIWVESHEATGSSFCFTAEFGIVDSLPVIDQTLPQTAFVHIENSYALRNCLQYLNLLGIHPVAITNLEQLFEKVDANLTKPDFIISETEHKSWTEVRQIAELKHNDGTSIPIIFLSSPLESNNDIDLLEIDQPFIQVISKPILPTHLVSAIKSLHSPGQLSRRRDDRAIWTNSKEETSYRALFKAYILIVEDDPINLQIAEELLTNVGVITDTAVNGSEAVKKVRQNQYDAVLMDIHMPVMDGISASVIIRQEGHRDLPIIALTAHTISDVALLPEEAKFTEVVNKPFLPDTLYSTLARLIRPSINTDREVLVTAYANDKYSEEGSNLAPEAQLNTLPSLPSLPGINLVLGQKTVGLPTDRYLNILRKFDQHHSGTPAKLQEAFKEKNWQEVHRIAHSLKSVGRSIGAEKICTLSEQLESAAKNNQVEASIVEALSDALIEAITSLSTLKT